MKTIVLPVLTMLLFLGCEQNKKKSTLVSDNESFKIAYNIHLPDTTRDDWEIMIMDMDGTDKKNITNHTDVAWTYYAHKNRLFFISDRDTTYRHYFLYEMDANGQNIKKVSDLRLEDSWMSSRNDGSEMVVAGRIGKEIRYQLFLLNTETGTYRQITSDTAAAHSDPCFSPDGSKIVFSYQANRRDRTTHEELYIMKDDGSEMMQLTSYPEDNPSAKEYGYKAGTPRWHPTEHFISYVSMQDGKNNIYAVTPDGKQQWKITEYPFSAGWHDWSSDGKWLVFNSTADEKQYHIMLMNWQSKEIRQLTDTTYRSQLGPVFVLE